MSPIFRPPATASRRLVFIGDVVPTPGIELAVPDDWDLVANLESPLTTAVTPEPGKVVLKGDPGGAHGCLGGRMVVANLANNHVMDYGHQGLADTIAYLEERGVSWFGAGETDTSVPAVVIEYSGMAIGLCGYVCASTHPVFATNQRSGVLPIEIDRIRDEVTALRRGGCDRVIVSLHWGAEEVAYPRPSDIRMARNIVDAGASMIVGHHAHCIQPCESYRNVLIFYGLGNAIMPDLNVPSGLRTQERTDARYVKRQRPWNRRSIAVEYNPILNVGRPIRLSCDGTVLRVSSDPGAANVVSGRRWPTPEGRFRLATLAGRLRCLAAGFADRPRLPGAHHLRGLFSQEP